MDKKYWLDDPRNIKKVVYALYAVCALLLAADFFYEKHAHFEFEKWFGFKPKVTQEIRALLIEQANATI